MGRGWSRGGGSSAQGGTQLIFCRLKWEIGDMAWLQPEAQG